MNYHLFVNTAKYPQIAETFEVIGRWGDGAVVEVKEDQIASFCELVFALTGHKEGSTMVGEDHYVYRAKADGTAQLCDRYEKWPYTAAEWERHFEKNKRQLTRERKKRDELLEKFEADTKKERGSSLPYKSGRYVSKTHGLWFPYRVKYAQKPGQPLVVFFHGGGEVGTDNVKPMFGYLSKRQMWSEFNKRDCTVLIPQSSQSGVYEYHDFIAAVKDLCEAVAVQAGADLTRVYCIGGSWGGAGTWLSAYLFPSFYACAVPLMGYLLHPSLPESLTPESLAHMKELPVWVAHSADDTTVPIGRDDETVAVLRELGAPVKYTRVDGKGHHHLVSYFLKTEPWAEWMFAQKK